MNVMKSPQAIGVVGVKLMLAGTAALHIDAACLCPPPPAMQHTSGAL
jgi:hypothetical protein